VALSPPIPTLQALPGATTFDVHLLIKSRMALDCLPNIPEFLFSKTIACLLLSVLL
jgi:hypothetical protein